MIHLINTRVLLSLATVVAAAAVIIGATFAFFSDTETSTDNVFAAGAIDLKIDNTSYVTDETGTLVASQATSWELDDLTDQLFFNFTDLKPGDIGEDTISIHVEDNDAWVCAAARVTQDIDATYTEPEVADDPTSGNPAGSADPTITDGELAENLNFAFWADDGDNVFELGEEQENGFFIQGPLSGLGASGQISLADSQNNVWGDFDVNNNPLPVPGGETRYIGKAWCFGELTPAPLPDREDPNPALNNPVNRGTGFNCNGAPSANNAAQTDRVMGDIQFYAVQSRNNADFTCSQNYTPVWPTVTPIPTPE